MARPFELIKERVIDCCIMPNEQYFSYVMARTSYIRFNDNDARIAEYLVGFV
jgi:hypothetical protein